MHLWHKKNNFFLKILIIMKVKRKKPSRGPRVHHLPDFTSTDSSIRPQTTEQKAKLHHTAPIFAPPPSTLADWLNGPEEGHFLSRRGTTACTPSRRLASFKVLPVCRESRNPAATWTRAQPFPCCDEEACRSGSLPAKVDEQMAQRERDFLMPCNPI